ncbi:MAG: hypothetical protein AB9836_04805 [Aminipila sp.]
MEERYRTFIKESDAKKLEAAKTELLDAIGKAFDIYKILDWLSNILNKFSKHKK